MCVRGLERCARKSGFYFCNYCVLCNVLIIRLNAKEKKHRAGRLKQYLNGKLYAVKLILSTRELASENCL